MYPRIFAVNPLPPAQAAQALAAARSRLAAKLAQDPMVDDVLARFDRWGQDLWDGLEAVYDAQATLPQVVDLIASGFAARSPDLRARDVQRLLRPDWFQRPDALGYVAYADLFAGTIEGVGQHIGYLQDLGVTYLHLMPLLQPRPAPNDGGYAVQDYRSVRPDLGTMHDLAQLASSLHQAGIALTLDLVLNHVAEEHAWAEQARVGDLDKQRYFLTFPDRTIPDQFEQFLPEVFPTFAPGNFTWNDQLNAWVWTTFNSWQWDLNWANPAVLCEFIDIILFLANHGVDCLRLDAIAFLWKTMGTSCQNQPQVHDITQVMRAAARIAAPALLFKAEAIVGPDDVVKYLGVGSHAGKISDLAYHNSLMVQVWSAFAMGSASLLTQSIKRFAAIPSTTAWATYLRCHDDIGWAIDDRDAAALGLSGPMHRAFCADYYAGQFPGSVARGAHFQSNPLTGDRRTSGTTASLAGVESALESGDDTALRLAIDKVLCGYAITLGFGGIPLIYMGDEIGLLNEHDFVANPDHAQDNRWLHRPVMDWQATKNADAGHGYGADLLGGLRRLIAARQECPALHAAVPPEVFDAAHGSVLVLRRLHPAGNVVQVFNVTSTTVNLDVGTLWPLSGSVRDLISGHIFELTYLGLTLGPYQSTWLTVTN